ncbi:uncharacterized protein LOC135486431 isoform X2 [Lineus longissimus]|uniref:uncharacterized protein LOC135486431 isoform X2 n=1 Tax=Lineus longissimus TaxID=88925 RepID=UPI00315CDBE3
MIESPRLRTKLVNGRLVKVLEETGFPERDSPYGRTAYLPRENEIDIKPYNLSNMPVLPPINSPLPREPLRMRQRPAPSNDIEELYRRLPVDGTMPALPISLSEHEKGIVMKELNNHLKRVKPHILQELRRDLMHKSGVAAVHEMSMALTRNMILIPPQLVRLVGAMFMSSAMPDSVNLDGMVDFMVNATSIEPDIHDSDVPGYPPLPDDIMRLFRFLPRHSDLPHEPTMLREQERHLLRNIIGQLLSDIPTQELREIYSELAQNDKEVLGCVPFKCLKQALDRRRIAIHPAVMRLAASQFVSKRSPGEFRYRDLMQFMEEAHRIPGSNDPLAKSEQNILPPQPPMELQNVLGQLPKYRDLPGTPLLLRESEKVALLKHVHEALQTADPKDLEEMYNELSLSDKNTLGALRFDEVVKVFSRQRLRLSQEIVRLLASHFVAHKIPGRVDFKKLMMFLSYAQKGEMPPIEMNDDGKRLPPPRLFVEPSANNTLPLSLQNLLSRMPPAGLPSEIMHLIREEKEALLHVLKSLISNIDPLKITSVYKDLSNQDNKMMGVIPFLTVRQALERKGINLPPDILQLLASQFIHPQYKQSIDFRKLLTFIGLALPNPPTIPELSMNPVPPLPPEIYMVLQRLPRSGHLPDKPLFINEFEKEQIRKYLEEVYQDPDTQTMLKDVYDAVKRIDVHSLGTVTLSDLLAAAEKRGLYVPTDIQQLLGALVVAPTLPGHVDYKRFLTFLSSCVPGGNLPPSKPDNMPSTPRPHVPAELDNLVGLLPRFDTGLPNSAMQLKEKEKALIMKHLHPMLGDVSGDRLRGIHEELLKCDRYQTGTASFPDIDRAFTRNLVYLPKPLLRLLASMFIPPRLPGEADFKKLLSFISAAVESPHHHPPDSHPTPRGMLPIPNELQTLIKLLPKNSELPRYPIYLQVPEQAKMQDYLQGILGKMDPQRLMDVYNTVAFMDKQRTGAIPLTDLRRALDQSNITIPSEIMQLIASLFLTPKIQGKIEYARFLRFLASCLQASPKMMNMMMDMPFSGPKIDAHQLEPHILHVPELRPLLRLIPAQGGLPKDPIVLLENERRVLLEYLHGQLRYINVDHLKEIYLNLSQFDKGNSGCIHFNDARHVLQQFQIELPPEAVRLMASLFVDRKMPDHVQYELLVKFLAAGLKAAPNTGVAPILGEAPGLLPELPAELQHLIELLPRESDIPDAPFTLKDSEQTKLAEYLHDRLRLFEPRLLRKIYDELRQLDRSRSGYIPFTDMVDVIDRFGLKLKYPILRLLVSMFVHEQGKLDYTKLLNFIQSAITKSPKQTPHSMSPVSQSPRSQHHRDMPPHHARHDAKLMRYLEENLKERPFDPERLRDAFIAADKHGKGTLQAYEVKDVARMNGVQLSEAVLDEIVERLDYRALGQLSWMQFVDFLEKCQSTPVHQHYIS